MRADGTRAAAPPPVEVEEPGEDVHRLGGALEARAEDVVNGANARDVDGGLVVDAVVQSEIDRMARISTVALARWMAGGVPQRVGRPARKSSNITANWPPSARWR